MSAPDKPALRRRLIAERRAMPGRDASVAGMGTHLAAYLDAWTGHRQDVVVGAYWPIRGEFDPLPVLAAWRGSVPGRRISLPVIDEATDRLRFHDWWPGCPMIPDRYGIPMPDGTPLLEPGLLIVPCVGVGPGGVRLGYGGGYYDRTLPAMDPRPDTLGIAFASAIVPDFVAEPHDQRLDAILTEEGLVR